jgi:hypothetical protein
VGKGVFHRMPATVPPPVRDRHAVAVGAPARCVAAARRLERAGWTVTVVTRDAGRFPGISRSCHRRTATEVVCATGIDHLEAVVLRHVVTGRIDAYCAAALFILSGVGRALQDPADKHS